jgi:hypothetical protein
VLVFACSSKSILVIFNGLTRTLTPSAVSWHVRYGYGPNSRVKRPLSMDGRTLAKSIFVGCLRRVLFSLVGRKTAASVRRIVNEFFGMAAGRKVHVQLYLYGTTLSAAGQREMSEIPNNVLAVTAHNRLQLYPAGHRVQLVCRPLKITKGPKICRLPVVEAASKAHVCNISVATSLVSPKSSQNLQSLSHKLRDYLASYTRASCCWPAAFLAANFFLGLCHPRILQKA